MCRAKSALALSATGRALTLGYLTKALDIPIQPSAKSATATFAATEKFEGARKTQK